MKQKHIIFFTVLLLNVTYVYTGTVMVFAPHPDDDIIGCGGTLIHHVKRGDNVMCVYMTSGEAGGGIIKRDELAAIREQEAAKATEKIGIKNLIFLREKDKELRISEDTVNKVVNLILQEAPTTLYAPHKRDGHDDHQQTYRIVIAAVKKIMNEKGRDWKAPSIFCYEVWTPLSTFSKKVDITDAIGLKLEALAEHKTQIANVKYDEAIKGLNNYRGIMSRAGMYAECFYQVHLRGS